MYVDNLCLHNPSTHAPCEYSLWYRMYPMFSIRSTPSLYIVLFTRGQRSYRQRAALTWTNYQISGSHYHLGCKHRSTQIARLRETQILKGNLENVKEADYIFLLEGSLKPFKKLVLRWCGPRCICKYFNDNILPIEGIRKTLSQDFQCPDFNCYLDSSLNAPAVMSLKLSPETGMNVSGFMKLVVSDDEIHVGVG